MSIKISNEVKNFTGTTGLQAGLEAQILNTPAQYPAGIKGRFFFAIDTDVIYYDNGTSWENFITSATGTGFVTINTAQVITAFKRFTSSLQLEGYAQLIIGKPDGYSSITPNIVLLDISGGQSYLISTNNITQDLYFQNSTSNTELLRLISNGNIAIPNGALGIGATPTGTNANLYISKNITGGTTSYGANNTGTIQSDVTTAAEIYHSNVNTQASAFTLSNLRHFQANQGTIGAGSTITNQFGYTAGSTLTGATNNYGFYGNIASGANRWNFYANGTALNYFNGRVLMGSTTDNNTNAQLQVNGSISFQNQFSRQTASYTPTLGAQNKIIEMNVATANNFTVPTNASVAFPIGTEIAVVQYGAGQTTIVAAGGVTLRSAGGALKLSAQYAWATIVKVGTNEWYVTGSLSV
jgi:hypothetical protein